MKYQGRDAYGRNVITGKMIPCNSQKGVVLEDEHGVRHFITNDRMIGPVEMEKRNDDLFGPL